MLPNLIHAHPILSLVALCVAIWVFMAAMAPAMATPVTNALKDALVKGTRALPASTTAVKSTAIDTGVSGSTGIQPGNVEYLLTAPAVTTSQLPDSKTFTYDIIHSDNSDLSSSSVLQAGILVQTGAGSAGAAGNTARYRPPQNAKRYIGFQVTPSASGTGDASAATATLEGMF